MLYNPSDQLCIFKECKAKSFNDKWPLYLSTASMKWQLFPVTNWCDHSLHNILFALNIIWSQELKNSYIQSFTESMKVQEIIQILY